MAGVKVFPVVVVRRALRVADPWRAYVEVGGGVAVGRTPGAEVWNTAAAFTVGRYSSTIN